MSTLRVRTSRTLLHTNAAVQRPELRRSLQTSRMLRVGKESDLHREKSGQQVEAEKQKQLKEQKEGKGEWKASLSSDSEDIVKADRDELTGSKENIKTLQEESAKKAEREQKGH